MDALSNTVAEFERHGLTDVAYLRLHFQRFAATKALLESTWHPRRGRVLDVGAHWLHQAYLYARDGYEVTAVDVPATLAIDAVQRLAQAHGIRLLACGDLAAERPFGRIADDAFDLVLFTEVIEHLAFNPVALWREIHRILAPGGRIVVTTPNHGALRSRLRRGAKHAFRGTGGLSVREILETPTYGHHWKEYTLAELREYFLRLSPDFAVRKAMHVEDYYGSTSLAASVARVVESAVPILRPHLHVEVELAAKQAGL